MVDTLDWYAECAEALYRYTTVKPYNLNAMEAVVRQLSLDAGNKAKFAKTKVVKDATGLYPHQQEAIKNIVKMVDEKKDSRIRYLEDVISKIGVQNDINKEYLYTKFGDPMDTTRLLFEALFSHITNHVKSAKDCWNHDEIA